MHACCCGVESMFWVEEECHIIRTRSHEENLLCVRSKLAAGVAVCMVHHCLLILASS